MARCTWGRDSCAYLIISQGIWFFPLSFLLSLSEMAFTDALACGQLFTAEPFSAKTNQQFFPTENQRQVTIEYFHSRQSWRPMDLELCQPLMFSRECFFWKGMQNLRAGISKPLLVDYVDFFKGHCPWALLDHMPEI